MRLRTNLFLLIVAAVLPLLAFAVLASWLLVQHQQDNFVAAVKDRNRAFMSAVDAELKGSITTLEALAAARSLVAGDLRAFHKDAAAVLATQESWLNVMLYDTEGRQLANAAAPYGMALPQKPQQPGSFEPVVRAQQPQVGGVREGGPFLKRPGIPVRVPVLREGDLVYVLTAVLKPETFEQLIVDQHLPPGWASGLVDANGRFVARVPQRPVGSMAGEHYLKEIRASREGWYRGMTVDGMDTYTSHIASSLSGWTVGFAIPAEQVTGGPKRAAVLMGGGLAMSLGLAIIIALRLGRRISQPMSELSAAALTLGSNVPPAPVGTSVREVAELSGALHKAAHDIQQRDSELRRRADELQRADTNKSQFLAVLSHELRNPLAPLLNSLTLLRAARESRASTETLAMMERQIGHLRRLIDDLLDVSRIDRGKLELRRERIAVDAVVRSAIETAKPNVEAKSHELMVRYAPESLYVEGDAVRLAQVLANLLNNAAKFTPAGGRIEIAIRSDAGEAVIRVKDNGAGFAPGDEQRIFDMFVQLDANRLQAAGGLGLGLTLVRWLVDMHGGRIEAQSAGAGRGAEFVVRLPLATAPRAAAVLASAPAPVAGQRRVLVVDDNTDAADSLAQILRLNGFEARACYDGADALEAAHEFRPHVAFLDLNMPGMTGVELGEKLHAQPWGREVKLVALTGMGQKSDIERTRAAGFVAHLTKPALVEDIMRLAAFDEPDNVVPLSVARTTQ